MSKCSLIDTKITTAMVTTSSSGDIESLEVCGGVADAGRRISIGTCSLKQDGYAGILCVLLEVTQDASIALLDEFYR